METIQRYLLESDSPLQHLKTFSGVITCFENFFVYF
jgi:hypothetical protein